MTPSAKQVAPGQAMGHGAKKLVASAPQPYNDSQSAGNKSSRSSRPIKTVTVRPMRKLGNTANDSPTPGATETDSPRWRARPNVMSRSQANATAKTMYPNHREVETRAKRQQLQTERGAPEKDRTAR